MADIEHPSAFYRENNTENYRNNKDRNFAYSFFATEQTVAALCKPADKQTDKSLSSMIKREYRDEKAVKNAINRLHSGEFVIVERDPDEVREMPVLEEPRPGPVNLAEMFADEDDDADGEFDAEDEEDEDEEDEEDEDTAEEGDE